jgi:hypothetical protein
MTAFLASLYSPNVGETLTLHHDVGACFDLVPSGEVSVNSLSQKTPSYTFLEALNLNW